MPSDTNGTGGEPEQPCLVVRLLGTSETLLDGRRLGAFNSLRLQRFLAVIAIRKDLQHRSRLAFELWPDSDERQARTNLRKLLHDFRHSLPDSDRFVEIDNEVVRWIPSELSDVDVLSFRDAVAAGDLQRAAELYTGDLLPACYDDWILSDRASLHATAHEVFASLAEEAAESGDHEATIRYTRRIVELEPTDEDAVRAQMQAHIAVGDRAAALRAYHRCAEALERDLAVTPGEVLGDLYRQLRVGAFGPDRSPDEDRAPVTDSPFVGRDVEMAGLESAWRSVQARGAHLVLVTGEPGIGKSRLVSELGRRVRAAGHVVVSARAYEAAGRPPWGPVVDLLRSEALRSQIDTLEPVWRSELARLLPELADVPDVEDPTRSGDLAQRYRLFDAVSRALLADERPRLLIIDDLQWCDTETIELIGFIARAGRAAPVLLVGTVRSEEVPESHPLHELADALGREQRVTSLPLEPLDEATTATLAALVRDQEQIDPELADRLWRETEGNPLFVIEALRAGITSDRGHAVLTPTMRAVLGSRLGQLPDPARRVAEVAAVIGRPFSISLLATITGTTEMALVDDVDELWRRRIIRDEGLSYDFSHDKLRAVALEIVSPARRRQLHRAVAAAIEVERAADIESAASQLAAHYDQAGMIEEAVGAYHAAGARAVSVSALDEAVAMFRRALSLLAEMPPSADRDQIELEIRIALGSPLVALDGYGSHGAHQLYERALGLCRKLDRPVDPPILRGLGLARLQGCRFDECSDMGRALLERADRDPVAGTEGRYLLGVSAFWRGDLADARDHLDGAITGYEPSRRGEHLASYAQDPRAVCMVRLALVELWEGDPGRADETARSAVEQAIEIDNLMTLGYVLTYASILAAEAEDLPRLSELVTRAESLSSRVSMRYLMIVVEGLRGWVEVQHGSAERIVDMERAVERSRAEGETLHLTLTLLLLARACELTGRYEQGRAAAQEALSWSRSRNQRYLEAELWRVDGELAHCCGDPDAAAESLREAVDVAASQAARWLELRALGSLVARRPEKRDVDRLEELVGSLPSGRDLPAFRAAIELLDELA